MSSIDSLILEAPDPDLVSGFYDQAFGLAGQVTVQSSTAPTAGFRGFTVSLLVSQPADADALIDSACAAGAALLKPAAKSLWGYGGVVQAPDGAIWKVTTSEQKNSGPVTRRVEQIVLLLGVTEITASKEFYVDRGLPVARSFGRKYVEFAMPSSPVALALYGRRALSKSAGVPRDGGGSHRLVIGNDFGSFTDPDGFAWEISSVGTARGRGSARARCPGRGPSHAQCSR
jgi:uncharacterized glyoxalase superfamily protein PhnB